jgi:hypothetical protein
VTGTELPLETATERHSDDAPERLLEVALMRLSVEAGLELGVKVGEVGPELPSEMMTEHPSAARWPSLTCCCDGTRIRLSEAVVTLGNRR